MADPKKRWVMPNANRVLGFIANTNAPCQSERCTTCGGRGHFRIRLRRAFPLQSELIAELGNISGKDVVRIGTSKNTVMAHLLTTLPGNARQTLIENWVSRTSADPELALGVLLWTQYGSSLDISSRNKLLVASEPLLVIRRSIRADLRKALSKEATEGMSLLEKLAEIQNYLTPLPPGLILPPRLLEKIENDILEERKAWKEEQLKKQAREEYLERISKLPFRERVSIILSDQSLRGKDWSEDWSVCTEEDIESLNADAVQELIDLCVGDLSGRWRGAISKLCDKRHQLRLEAMDELRQKHGQLSQEEQLKLLVQNPSIPIEHYPIELAEHVTPEWVETITSEERERLTEIMEHTKLRVWAKVFNRYHGVV